MLSRAEGAGIDLDADAAKRAVERLKEREHRGYHYEAADASFELLLRREAGAYEPLFRLEGFRVITEKRADGKVETEATIKIWVDGRRYVRTAEGNGPVNALDRALRDAITELHPHLAEIELVNYKVRILDAHHGTGAVTRVLLDSSDGQDSWGSIGVSENIIEASWEALVDSLEYAFQPRRPPVAAQPAPEAEAREPASVPPAGVSQPEPIPLARPDLGEREEELVLEVLRSGRLSLGPMLERFERDFADWLGVDDAVAVSSGTAALHLGVRALGWGPGDEVVTSPFSFVASANCLLYEGATPVFCDVDPVTLDLDPAAAARRVGERTVGLLPVDILGYPAAMPELERLAAERGLGLLEDACEALGAVDSEGVRVGARGNLATFAFYANKQLTTGEGGVIVPSSARDRGAAAQRAQPGPGPDMGWLDHERLGFNYRLTDLQAAIGVAQLERVDELLAERAAGGGAVRASGSAPIGGSPAGEGDPDGLVLPCADRGAERRSWFIYAVLLPAGADRDAVLAELAQRGIEAKAYMPCIHLMPHYRERFGYREGQFPVAEDASSRLLALPFFGAMGEAQVERVTAALGAALEA